MTWPVDPERIANIYKAVSLFLRIVYRRWEDKNPDYPPEYTCNIRISPSTAWRISRNIHFNEGSSYVGKKAAGALLDGKDHKEVPGGK